MDEKVSILGFAGSLRKGSYNRALLRAASALVPAGAAAMETFDLEGIPPFNQDFETSPTEKVRDFKARIKASDAVLIATPEYNYSIPGVLKNAIDWASRPYGDSAFAGKPVAVMGASIGSIGTARAQYHLRQCFVFLDMYPLNYPEVMVPLVQDKVDRDGNVTDRATLDLVKDLMINLVKWSKFLRGHGGWGE